MTVFVCFKNSIEQGKTYQVPILCASNPSPIPVSKKDFLIGKYNVLCWYPWNKMRINNPTSNEDEAYGGTLVHGLNIACEKCLRSDIPQKHTWLVQTGEEHIYPGQNFV